MGQRLPVMPTFLEVEAELGRKVHTASRRHAIRSRAAPSQNSTQAGSSNQINSATGQRIRPPPAPPVPRTVDPIISPSYFLSHPPGSVENEEKESLDFFDKYVPKEGIPEDVIQYMQRKAEDMKQSGFDWATHVGGKYLTDEELMQNVGAYHKRLCLLGCHMRCPTVNQDQWKAPVEKEEKR